MKNFLTQKKNELKFVYNFHCAGKQFIIPFNGEMPNMMATKFPEISSVFKEIVQEAQFAAGTAIGPSTENIGIVAAGDAADWITSALSIPAAEAEIGSWENYNEYWFP